MAGCTANVVLLTQDKFYVANAGDARCVLFKRDGEIEALSKDHKPDSEEEKARINKAGGYVNEGRINDNLNLSRAIGDLEYKKNNNLKPEEQIISAEPDIEVRELKGNEDFLLIGCDGIWETLNIQSIHQILKEEVDQHDKPVDGALEVLLDKLIAKDTQEGTGCDNMSAVMIKFK